MDRFRLRVRERVYRFTVPTISPLLGHFGPELTPATLASVAIDRAARLAAIPAGESPRQQRCYGADGGRDGTIVT